MRRGYFASVATILGVSALIAAGGITTTLAIESKPNYANVAEMLKAKGIDDANPSCWNLTRNMTPSRVSGENRYDTAIGAINSAYGSSPINVLAIEIPHGNAAPTGDQLTNAIEATSMIDGQGFGRGTVVFTMNPAWDYKERDVAFGPGPKDEVGKNKWTPSSRGKLVDFTGVSGTGRVRDFQQTVGYSTVYAPNVGAYKNSDKLVVFDPSAGASVIGALNLALAYNAPLLSRQTAEYYLATHSVKDVYFVGGEGQAWAGAMGIPAENYHGVHLPGGSSAQEFEAITVASLKAAYPTLNEGDLAPLVDTLFVVRGSPSYSSGMLADAVNAMNIAKNMSDTGRSAIMFYPDSVKGSRALNAELTRLSPSKLVVVGGDAAVAEDSMKDLIEASIERSGMEWRKNTGSCKPELKGVEKTYIPLPHSEAYPRYGSDSGGSGTYHYAQKGDQVLYRLRIVGNNIYANSLDTIDSGNNVGTRARFITDTLPAGLKFVKAYRTRGGISTPLNYNSATRQWEKNSTGDKEIVHEYTSLERMDPGAAAKYSYDCGYYSGGGGWASTWNPRTCHVDSYNYIWVVAQVTDNVRDGQVLTNKACTVKGDPDAALEQKCGEADINIAEPKLDVVKVMDSPQDLLTQGDTKTYTVKVMNSSYVKSRDNKVYERVIEGLKMKRLAVSSAKSISSSGSFTYSYSPSTNEWMPATSETVQALPLLDLGPRAGLLVKVEGEVTKDKGQSLANTTNLVASCTGDTCKTRTQAPTMCAEGDATCSVDTRQQGNAYLRVSKVVHPQDEDKAPNGNKIRWNIEVENLGNITARNVVITDEGGNGIAKDTVRLGSDTVQATNTYKISSLSAGQRQTIVAYTTPTADVVSNTACAEGDNTLKVCSSDEGSDKSSVSVTKERVYPERTDGLYYRVRAENKGSGGSSPMSLLDTMTTTSGAYPQPYSITSFGSYAKKSAVKPTQIDYYPIPASGKSDVIVRANRVADLPREVVTNTVTPADDLLCDKNKDLCASIKDSPVNIDAQLLSVVDNLATIKVSVTPTFNETAHGVSVRSIGVTNVSHGTFADPSAGTVYKDTWTVGDIKAGDTHTAVITAKVDDAGFTSNVVAGTALRLQPDGRTCQANQGLASDTDSCDQVTTLTRDPDATRVTKTFTGITNGKATYSIEVVNNSTLPTRPMVFKDTMSHGKAAFTQVSHGSATGDTWNMGVLEGMGKASATVVGDITPGVQVRNDIKPTDDPTCQVASECAFAYVAPVQVAKVALTKDLKPGDTVQWSLQVGIPRGKASNVVITELPGAGVTNGAFSQTTIGSASGDTWTIPELVAGQPARALYTASANTQGKAPNILWATWAGSPRGAPSWKDGAAVDCSDETTLDGDKDSCAVSDAQGSTPNPDPDPDPDPDPSVSTPRVSKTFDGEKFTVEVKNPGTQPTRDLTFVDDMTGFDGAYGFVSATKGSVQGKQWTLGVLQPGETATAIVTMTSRATTRAALVSNQVRPTDIAHCTAGDPQCASASIGRLGVKKTLTSGEGFNGATLTWRIDVKNISAHLAPAVTLKDVPATGLSQVSDTTFDVGDLVAGETKTFTVSAKVSDSRAMTNRAYAYHGFESSSAPTSCQSNIDTASDTDACDESRPTRTDGPSLKIHKEVVENTTTPTWKVSVANTGGMEATDVRVYDALTNATFANPSMGSVDKQEWTIPTLAPGAQASATVSAPMFPVIVNTVWVSEGPSTKPVACSANDTLDEDHDGCDMVTWVKPGPTLDKEIVSAKDGRATWKVSVKNPHTVTLSDLLIKDKDAVFSQGGKDSWTIASIKPGETLSQEVTSTYSTDATQVTNTAWVGETRPDICEGDCKTATHTLVTKTIEVPPSVKLLKEYVPDTTNMHTWKITVSNPGKTDVNNVTVSDEIIRGASSLVLINPSQGGATGGVWNVGTLQPGRHATITAQGVPTGGVATNRAWVGTTKPAACKANATLEADDDGCAEASSSENTTIQVFVKPTLANGTAWEVNIKNASATTARSVTSGFSLEGAQAGLATVKKGSVQNHQWAIGELQPGEQVSMLLNASVSGQSVTMKAWAGTSQPTVCEPNGDITLDKDACDLKSLDMPPVAPVSYQPNPVGSSSGGGGGMGSGLAQTGATSAPLVGIALFMMSAGLGLLALKRSRETA